MVYVDPTYRRNCCITLIQCIFLFTYQLVLAPDLLYFTPLVGLLTTDGNHDFRVLNLCAAGPIASI